MPSPSRVFYVTSSESKIQENAIFAEKATLEDGTRAADICSFVIQRVPIKEILEIDIRVMVQAEVVSAYSQLKAPCVVEHAGLVFAELQDAGFPGGLTKPMWNALKPERFMKELGGAGRRAIAFAAVAYCDGQNVIVFSGETTGSLAMHPRGSRDFYWDTVFEPDDATGKATGKTYAEIVDDPALGLEYKVLHLSQSTKAMRGFLEHLRKNSMPALWA